MEAHATAKQAAAICAVSVPLNGMKDDAQAVCRSGAAMPANFASESDIASTWSHDSEAAMAAVNPDGTGPYNLDPATEYTPSAVRRDLGWEAELRYHNAANSSATAEQLQQLLREHHGERFPAGNTGLVG